MGTINLGIQGLDKTTRLVAHRHTPRDTFYIEGSLPGVGRHNFPVDP